MSPWEDYLQLMAERPEDFAGSDTLRIITDESEVRAFEKETGSVIGVIYHSPFRIFVVDLVEDADGRRFTYERLMNHVRDNAVVTVPVCQGKFVLLEQFRHSIRRNQYAFPRGFGEPGLSGADNARKELSEELGAQVEQVLHLGAVVADSGMCGTQVEAYVCQVTDVRLMRHYEEIEDMVLLTPEELREWIGQGKVDDGFTLAALSLYHSRSLPDWCVK